MVTVLLQCVVRKSWILRFSRSLLITYLITLSLEKEIIVLEKCLEKLLNFGSKNNTIPKEGDWSFHFLPLTLIVIYFFLISDNTSEDSCFQVRNVFLFEFLQLCIWWPISHIIVYGLVFYSGPWVSKQKPNLTAPTQTFTTEVIFPSEIIRFWKIIGWGFCEIKNKQGRLR